MDSLFKDVNFYIFEKNVERSTEVKVGLSMSFSITPG